MLILASIVAAPAPRRPSSLPLPGQAKTSILTPFDPLPVLSVGVERPILVPRIRDPEEVPAQNTHWASWHLRVPSNSGRSICATRSLPVTPTTPSFSEPSESLSIRLHSQRQRFVAALPPDMHNGEQQYQSSSVLLERGVCPPSILPWTSSSPVQITRAPAQYPAAPLTAPPGFAPQHSSRAYSSPYRDPYPQLSNQSFTAPQRRHAITVPRSYPSQIPRHHPNEKGIYEGDHWHMHSAGTE